MTTWVERRNMEGAEVLHRHFDSYESFVDFIDEHKDDKTSGSYEASRTEKQGRSWDLGADFDDALEMATTGWAEGRKKISKGMGEALAAREMDITRDSIARDVWGFAPDVDAYLAGDERCLLRPDVEYRTDDNVVRLRISLAASCAIKANEKVKWGVGVAYLIDQLEQQGKQVEVTAAYYTSGHDGSVSRYYSTFLIKSAGEPLDLDRLCYVIAHPAFHRRLIFKLRELEQDLRGYGGPLQMPKLTDAEDEDIITIEGVQYNTPFLRDPQVTVERVMSLYEEQISPEEEIV